VAGVSEEPWLPKPQAGNFCLRNGLPALNCNVVGQQTGTPGHGVVVSKNKTWRDDARDSLNTDWFKF
jgi:hypothetical protein